MTRRKREPETIPPARVRNKQIKFWATQEEIDLIHQKMALYGTTNRGAYLRKMAIDGYTIRLEVPELKEILNLLRPAANNVNQLARKANSGGQIYQEDLEDIQHRLDQIYDSMRKILYELAKLH